MLAILQGKKRIIICIGVAIIIMAIAGILMANRNQPVTAGQNVVITVTADSLEDVYGYQFQMNYNADELEYADSITSKLDEISFIFCNSFDGYELVGATMTGENDGVNGRNQAVCELVFTAKADSTLHDLDISISDIDVVKVAKQNPDANLTNVSLDPNEYLDYVEGIEGWKLNVSIQQ